MVIFAVIYYFAQLLAVVIFVPVSLMRENLRGLRENLRQKSEPKSATSKFMLNSASISSTVLSLVSLKFRFCNKMFQQKIAKKYLEVKGGLISEGIFTLVTILTKVK